VFGAIVAGGDFNDITGEKRFVFGFVDIVDHEFDDGGLVGR
jgi:hypothetical protein